MSCKTVQSAAARLRVFRFILEFHRAEERWPTRREVAQELRMTRAIAEEYSR
jgi:hypothetical protein